MSQITFAGVQVEQGIARRLAALIEKGRPHIGESHFSFFIRKKAGIFGCVLAMAFVGVVGNSEQALRRYKPTSSSHFTDVINFFTKELGIPFQLADEVSLRHSRGTPVEHIIAQLKGI